MVVAEWFINLLGVYTGIGLLFAIAFLTVGISQVDPDSKGSGVGFRLIILPGVAALDRKSTRLNSSHQIISYAVFCLKKKKNKKRQMKVLSARMQWMVAGVILN